MPSAERETPSACPAYVSGGVATSVIRARTVGELSTGQAGVGEVEGEVTRRTRRRAQVVMIGLRAPEPA